MVSFLNESRHDYLIFHPAKFKSLPQIFFNLHLKTGPKLAFFSAKWRQVAKSEKNLRKCVLHVSLHKCVKFYAIRPETYKLIAFLVLTMARGQINPNGEKFLTTTGNFE